MAKEAISPPTENGKVGREPGASKAKRRLDNVPPGEQRIAKVFLCIFLLYALLTVYLVRYLEYESNDHSNPIVEGIMHKLKGINHVPIRRPADMRKPVQDKQLPPYASQNVRLEDIKDIETLQHTFPIHASGDLEEIDHPGIFLADEHQFQAVLYAHPELPKDGKIRVPKFWRPVAYGENGVRDFLGKHGKRLITPEEANQIGSFYNNLETIYISVASYRDPECLPTVEDMFLRADNPERLRVAIIDQRMDNDSVAPCSRPRIPCDEDPEQPMCKYAHLIDSFEISAPLSIGPVFARHLANRMYRGEYFAMQIDSHVRFIEHWDTSIVMQWKQAKNEMGVISTYLSDIIESIDPVTHENRHPNRPIMCKTDYEGNGKMKHLRHGQQPEGLPGIHGEPTLHPFWAAGFSFARGHFVIQVPYDQYREEIFQGLRGFTYGYDYYTAEVSVAFHMYAIKENKEKRKKVKLFWENGVLYPGSSVEGMKRLNGIIGMGDPGDEYYNKDEEEYGLGQVRPKEKFFRLYGIHTDTKTVEDHLCTFVGRPMMKKFKPFLRENGMGIDFSKIDFEWKDPANAAKGKLNAN
eukprot:scaffold5024_cov136-Cylindrotheca_fusiformis.AAC.18